MKRKAKEGKKTIQIIINFLSFINKRAFYIYSLDCIYSKKQQQQQKDDEEEECKQKKKERI